MHRTGRGSARIQWLLLLPALVLAGCRERPSLAKLGPAFTATEAPSTGKAQVYVYWPSEEEGSRSRIWIATSPEILEVLEVQRGGFAVFALAPGESGLDAQTLQDFSDFGVASLHLANLQLKVAAGSTYFVRVEQEPRLLTTRLTLRPVERAVAEPQIRRCRRLIPLSPEETVDKLLSARSQR